MATNNSKITKNLVKPINQMSEVEKLDAGLPYDFFDAEVDARKLNAVKLCQQLNTTDVTDYEKRYKIISELFGSCGQTVTVLPIENW